MKRGDISAFELNAYHLQQTVDYLLNQYITGVGGLLSRLGKTTTKRYNLFKMLTLGNIMRGGEERVENCSYISAPMCILAYNTFDKNKRLN